MRLRKEVGQSGIAGYWWENDGDVVEVPWDFGAELLALKGAGFSEASDDEPEPETGGYDPGLPGDVPDGTALQILDWVGVDAARAGAALKAERGKGTEARTSLIAKLEKLV